MLGFWSACGAERDLSRGKSRRGNGETRDYRAHRGSQREAGNGSGVTMTSD